MCWLAMAISEPRRQSCTVCGYPDKFDYHIADDVWRGIVPPEHRDHVVCLGCFDDFAHDKGQGYGDSLRTLYFAGRAATMVFAKT